MRTGSVLLAVAVLLALAGCTPAGSRVTAAPSASATPVFASDAEALAAAEKAYAAYLKVSDQIGNDGGKNPERITDYVTTSRLETEVRGSKVFASQGIRTFGSTTFDNPVLQQVSRDLETRVAFYACWDASNVRVIGASGVDVTPADRKSRQTLEIVFTTVGGKLPLRLESDNPWSGPSSC